MSAPAPLLGCEPFLGVSLYHFGISKAYLVQFPWLNRCSVNKSRSNEEMDHSTRRLFQGLFDDLDPACGGRGRKQRAECGRWFFFFPAQHRSLLLLVKALWLSFGKPAFPHPRSIKFGWSRPHPEFRWLHGDPGPAEEHATHTPLATAWICVGRAATPAL